MRSSLWMSWNLVILSAIKKTSKEKVTLQISQSIYLAMFQDSLLGVHLISSSKTSFNLRERFSLDTTQHDENSENSSKKAFVQKL